MAGGRGGDPPEAEPDAGRKLRQSLSRAPPGCWRPGAAGPAGRHFHCRFIVLVTATERGGEPSGNNRCGGFQATGCRASPQTILRLCGFPHIRGRTCFLLFEWFPRKTILQTLRIKPLSAGIFFVRHGLRVSPQARQCVPSPAMVAQRPVTCSCPRAVAQMLFFLWKSYRVTDARSRHAGEREGPRHCRALSPVRRRECETRDRRDSIKNS